MGDGDIIYPQRNMLTSLDHLCYDKTFKNKYTRLHRTCVGLFEATLGI